ncbi:MAG: hypothetical protein A4E55_01823 [Pelotomaculum sp. PtaU1.Bin035]|nr:MAG: hypothetical protein A4E55_01823 [Pelotomaculum sp. PtaU1.Bin035]
MFLNSLMNLGFQQLFAHTAFFLPQRETFSVGELHVLKPGLGVNVGDNIAVISRPVGLLADIRSLLKGDFLFPRPGFRVFMYRCLGMRSLCVLGIAYAVDADENAVEIFFRAD